MLQENPRSKAIQLLKNVFQTEEDRKGIDNVIRHKCCKGITMEHKKKRTRNPRVLLAFCLKPMMKYHLDRLCFI